MGSDFDANNRTMGVSLKESTMRRDVVDNMQGQQIRTEYDSKPWVPKNERDSETKDYLRATAQIQVDLSSGLGEQELPSQERLIQQTPPQGTMKARIDMQSMQKFATTQSDRSDLGMSNASSVGLPGEATLRAGIALGGTKQQAPPNRVSKEQTIYEETLAKQMSSGSKMANLKSSQ